MSDDASEGVEVRCSCGGTVTATVGGVFMHTLPTRAEFDAIEDFGEAAEFLARLRKKIEENIH